MDMIVVVSMLRAVNVGGHNRIKMEALRALYESLGLRDAQTYVQSGNVVFKAATRDLPRLPERIADGIERSLGFRPEVIVRTAAELREAIARNPFAGRPEIEPSRLLVTFLAGDPGAKIREQVLAVKTDPEELRIAGREVYIYSPNGMARPKMSWPRIEKMLKTTGTGRNWNTVRNLLELAEKLEAGGSSAAGG
jgi:uncharacterized protein (DUF1697 family)